MARTALEHNNRIGSNRIGNSRALPMYRDSRSRLIVEFQLPFILNVLSIRSRLVFKSVSLSVSRDQVRVVS